MAASVTWHRFYLICVPRWFQALDVVKHVMSTPQVMKPACPTCESTALFNSRSRGMVEELYFILGGELYRCGNCEARFAHVGRRIVALQHLDGSGKKIGSSGSWVVTATIIAGLILCLLIGLAILHYFNRWPF
jgi:hypothetical protein